MLPWATQLPSCQLSVSLFSLKWLPVCPRRSSLSAVFVQLTSRTFCKQKALLSGFCDITCTGLFLILLSHLSWLVSNSVFVLLNKKRGGGMFPFFFWKTFAFSHSQLRLLVLCYHLNVCTAAACACGEGESLACVLRHIPLE